MILEIVAIVLSAISIILAVLAVYDTRKINKETSGFLIQIKTYSENINNRAMTWLEQLIFPNRDKISLSKSDKGGSQTKIEKDAVNTNTDLLNFLYAKKAATLEEIIEGLETDYATAKSLIIRMRYLIKNYTDTKNRTVYYLSETEKEAKEKYPEPPRLRTKEIRPEDLPF